MTKEERRQIAEKYFLEGYNCAQAVVLSFAEEVEAGAQVEAGASDAADVGTKTDGGAQAGADASNAADTGTKTDGGAQAEARASISRENLSRLASSFGGGMGRMREVCGAVSGMFMVFGLLRGYDGPEIGDIKAKHYADIQELARRFREKNGSIVCRELLGIEGAKVGPQAGQAIGTTTPLGDSQSASLTSPTPTPRTPDFYKKRPCHKLVGDAAEILHEFLEER